MEPGVKTITLAPMRCYFSNENRAMGLRPHQHYAEVTLEFETTGELGFPVFEATVGPLAEVLRYLTEKPFRDSTNERVTDSLAESFEALIAGDGCPTDAEGAASAWERAKGVLAQWGGDYRLASVTLAVMGAPDDIGHSDGFTIYSTTL
jgi:hypothetical protein